MKKMSNIYVILVCVVLAMIAIQSLVPAIGDVVAQFLTFGTAVVGVASVVYEMKRSADIAACDFILQLQKFFQGSDEIQTVFTKLDKAYFAGKEPELTNDDRNGVVAYLSFLEMMSVLVLKGSMRIADIDGLFAYHFFLCTNAKPVQDAELVKFADHYENIYKVYQQWLKFRKSKGADIPFTETPLVA
ncbi:MAG: hypothetical protein LBL84_03420 [Candidatus Nomurabacteria bacterium]|nr:hypothetical protein [Candidatus Nomurabacteria bacterium]